MAQSIRQYAAKQGVISGICTMIICGILFFFMVAEGTNFETAFIDLSLTVFCTTLIGTWIQIALTKGHVKKGAVPMVGELDDQVSYLLIPKNNIAFLLLISVMALIIFGLAPLGILALVIGESGEAPKMWYVLLKSLMAGSAGGYGTYHANVFACRLHQEKLGLLK